MRSLALATCGAASAFISYDVVEVNASELRTKGKESAT